MVIQSVMLNKVRVLYVFLISHYAVTSLANHNSGRLLKP